MLKPTMNKVRIPAAPLPVKVARPLKKAKTEEENETNVVVPSSAEEKDHHTSSPLNTSRVPMETTTQDQKSALAPTPKMEEGGEDEQQGRSKHPKGHSVHTIASVLEFLDKKPFLRVTDTATLNDVWVSPISCVPDPEMPGCVDLNCHLILEGTKIAAMLKTFTIYGTDLLKLLYLASCFECDFDGKVRLDFDMWLNEVMYQYGKEKGYESSRSHEYVALYLINNHKINFHPIPANPSITTFFRLSRMRSYPVPEDKKDFEITKHVNPWIIKCPAVPGKKRKFEYMIEGKLIWAPGLYGENGGEEEEEMPPTQVLDN